ncbi:TIR domain-containing protein [Shewanella sp. SP1S2-4]|uniref:TIR domain-containing protein n=1 Tax=Shewanella sp. SP1S2-4 TaxID=3063537 RepID=UPI00288FB369|nr:TIR domain-containing protein [Shewanella sp. SP1S2-4]MDT3322223.1 TIR domain-containing protein [Shewanella sp. SP1S2-4]
MTQYKYKAFISYSHRDKLWGDWLHKSLEKYSIPKALRGKPNRDGKVPDKLFPIFRDREELPTATDLGAVISNAIESSAYLIVICSPNSAKSLWVEQEILAFKRLGRSNRILAIVVDGEPNASVITGKEDQECFPNALRYEIGEDGELTETPTEPLAADARAGKDGKSNALLKLAAGLLGVNFNDLKQREKIRRRNQLIGYAVAATLLFGSALGYWQYAQNIEQNRLLEQSAKLTTEAQAAIKAGDTQIAIQKALQALPANLTNLDRPYYAKAEAVLSKALYQHKEQQAVLAHDGGTQILAYDAKHDQLFTTGQDGKIKQWQASTLTFKKELINHDTTFNRMQMHPTQPLLITLDANNKVAGWDIESGQRRFEFYAYVSKEIQFSADGNYLFADNQIWNLADNINVTPKMLTFNWSDVEKVIPIQNSDNILIQVKHPDKHQLYISGLNSEVNARQIALPESIPVRLNSYQAINSAYAFKNGSIFLVDENTNAASIVNSSYQKQFEPKVSKVLSLDDTKLVFFNDDDDTIYTFDSETQLTTQATDRLDIIFLGQHGDIQSLQNLQSVLVQTEDSVSLINTVTSKKIPIYQDKQTEPFSYGRKAHIPDSVLIPQDNRLLIALDNGQLKAFDLTDQLAYQPLQFKGTPYQYRPSSDSRYSALLTREGNLYLLNKQQKSLLLIPHPRPITNMQFGPKQQLVFIDAESLYVLKPEHLTDPIAYSPFPAPVPLSHQLISSLSQNAVAVQSNYGQWRTFDITNMQWQQENETDPIIALIATDGGNILKRQQQKMQRLSQELVMIDSQDVAPLSMMTSLPEQRIFSDNGNFALWAELSGNIYYVDLKTGNTLAKLTISDKDVGLSLSSSGETALITTAARVFVLKPNQQGGAIEAEENWQLIHNAILPDQSLFMLEYNDEQTRWKSFSANINTGKKQLLHDWEMGKHTKIISGKTNVIVLNENETVLLNLSTGQQAPIALPFYTKDSKIVYSSPNLDFFLIADNQQLSLWKLGNTSPQWTLDNYYSGLQVVVDRQQQYFALGNSSRASIYALDNAKELANHFNFSGLAYGFDTQKQLIVWHNNGLLCHWDWQKNGSIFNAKELTDKNACVYKQFNDGFIQVTDNHVLQFSKHITYSLLGNTAIPASIVCDATEPLLPLRRNSKSIICKNNDGNIQVLNIANGKLTEPFKTIKIKYITASLDGQTLAIMDKDNQIWVKNIRSTEPEKALFAQEHLRSLSINDQGTLITSVDQNWTAHIRDLITGAVVSEYKLEIEQPHQEESFLLLTDEQQDILMVFISGQVYRFNKNGLQQRFRVENALNLGVTKISQLQHQLIQAGWDGIKRWNTLTGERLADIPTDGSFYDPTKLFIDEALGQLWFADNGIVAVDLISGKRIAKIEGDFQTLARSPDGTKVVARVSQYFDFQSKLFDLNSSEPLATLASNSETFLAFTAPNHLLSVSAKGHQYLWDLTEPAKPVGKLLPNSVDGLDVNNDWLMHDNFNQTVVMSAVNHETVYTSVLVNSNSVFGTSEGKQQHDANQQFIFLKTGDFSIDTLTRTSISHNATITTSGKIADFKTTIDGLVTLSEQGILQTWQNSGALISTLKDDDGDMDKEVDNASLTIAGPFTLSIKGRTVLIWNTDALGVIGKITASDNMGEKIVTAEIDLQTQTLYLVMDSGYIQGYPLLPSGQALIDLATKTVQR